MAETETGLRLRLYKLLLDKYSSLINEKETKTVGEIKALVNSFFKTFSDVDEMRKCCG